MTDITQEQTRFRYSKKCMAGQTIQLSRVADHPQVFMIQGLRNTQEKQMKLKHI